MKRKTFASLGLLAVALLSSIILLRNKPSNPAPVSMPFSAVATERSESSIPAAAASRESSALQESEAVVPLAPNDQVKEARRMVAAHVSLRSPEVADPDSETNRRIMQQMVMQAFENAKNVQRK